MIFDWMKVAPLAGAWIEIATSLIYKMLSPVAPLAGAWIEISEVGKRRRSYWSLPLRERGLKSLPGVPEYNSIMSLPLRERGLKSLMERPGRQRNSGRSPCGSVD